MAPSDSNHSSAVHKSISTTSLAKHFQSVHLNEEEISNNDFCNGFWGLVSLGLDFLECVVGSEYRDGKGRLDGEEEVVCERERERGGGREGERKERERRRSSALPSKQ